MEVALRYTLFTLLILFNLLKSSMHAFINWADGLLSKMLERMD